MTTPSRTALWLFAACLSVPAAEPGAGIVVDSERQVWYTDSGAGVVRLTSRGELTPQSKQPARWLGFDSQGLYAQSKPERYQRITGKGVSPAVLASTHGPIAIGPDGDVYYAASNEAGPLHILRLMPDGQNYVVAQIPDNTKGKKLRKVNGIAVGPDGAIYITGNHTVRKVTKQGAVSSVVGPLTTLPDCAKVPGLKKAWRPYMRGLTVDAGGAIYVAATGCSSVVRIGTDGKMTTVLQSETGWSPTGVAMYDHDLYVLEYQNAGSTNRREWAPRVRKLDVNGKVTLLGSASHPRS